jgi:uncharacterized protein YkwD
MPRLIIALAITGVAALATAPAATAADCKGEDLEAADQTAAQVAGAVVCLVNERRAAAGIPPVHRNERLAQAAVRHSRDMVERRYFAHTAPGGVTFLDRITDTGYMQGARSWLVGENLVWGSGEMSTPSSMVQTWMDSAPHRENLLRSRFREVGVGAMRGSPVDRGDENAMTVTSEYGYRAGKKPGSRKSRKAKTRKAKKARKARKARGRVRARG